MKVASRRLLVRRSILIPAFASIWLVSIHALALTITSPPTLTRATNAPLAGILQLATDVPSRVSVSVNDGTTVWTHDFLDYGANHSLTLLGFKPNRTNEVTVTARDQYQNAVTADQPVAFITGPVPSDFPKMVLLTNQPERMEPGYTLFRIVNNTTGNAYLTIVDNAAEVVWYSGVPSTLDVRQLANGDLFIPLATNFVEINMLGNTVNSWNVPASLTIDSHDGVPTDHGTILYINDATRVVANFPTSSTDPNAPTQTASVQYNRIIEISATNSVLLNNWSLIDMLQPTRIDYLTFTIHSFLGWDCEHANAVIEDPRDGSIIVSMRHQDAVIKFSRAGQLKWILGPHENWNAQFQPYLLTPVGAPFEWNYAQHAPQITPRGTLLIYDDGNFRASPFDASVADQNNYTRAVEYSINEQTMEVSQVWDYGRTNALRIFTDRVGNADWLPQSGNVLVTFGNVNYVNGSLPSSIAPSATMLRIQEVTHDESPEVVFDLAAFDYSNTSPTYRGTFAYRSHRIPDLYSHLPQPVTDLTVQFINGNPTLQFSGDQTRTYSIQASSDLTQWQEIGLADYSGDGSYSLTDPASVEVPARFYRVVTN
jgi:hypothetical protein